MKIIGREHCRHMAGKGPVASARNQLLVGAGKVIHRKFRCPHQQLYYADMAAALMGRGWRQSVTGGVMKAVKCCDVAAITLIGVSASVFAHHGTAGSYDQSKWVTVKGVVKEFRWRNPHSAIFITGKDEAGKEVTYAIETGSPNVLVKQGYTRNLMKPGDEVSLQMHPGLGTPSNGESLSLRSLRVNGKEIKSLQAEAESP